MLRGKGTLCNLHLEKDRWYEVSYSVKVPTDMDVDILELAQAFCPNDHENAYSILVDRLSVITDE